VFILSGVIYSTYFATQSKVQRHNEDDSIASKFIQDDGGVIRVALDEESESDDFYDYFESEEDVEDVVYDQGLIGCRVKDFRVLRRL
jgi:hypothetical protein